jgi:hypothetical protein
MCVLNEWMNSWMFMAKAENNVLDVSAREKGF